MVWLQAGRGALQPKVHKRTRRHRRRDRRKSYYDEAYLPKKLDRVDEQGNLYFDGSNFPWKLADDFAEDKRWGYPKWKVVLGKLTGKGKKGD